MPYSMSSFFLRFLIGRLNHVTKAFVENRDAGKTWDECPIEDHQAQGIIKMPLTVARYAGSPDLFQIVDGVVNVIHRSAVSVLSSRLLALILERILLSTDSPRDAISWAGSPEATSRLSPGSIEIIRFILNDSLINEYASFTIRFGKAPLASQPERYRRMKIQSNIVRSLMKTSNLQEALDSLPSEDKEYVDGCLLTVPDTESTSATLSQVVGALGLSCEVPGALLSSLYIARWSSNYAEAVEANILAGGDNCSRSLVIGGLFGGASGQIIPEDYLRQMHEAALAEMCSLASEIAASNTNLA